MIRTPFGEIRHDGDVLAIVFERDYTATPDEIWAAETGWDLGVFPDQTGDSQR